MEAIGKRLRYNEEVPLSVNKVVSNDDLLHEILLRLPVISLVLCKSVSKRWLSLIKDDDFIKRRNRIPKIDPPSCLFFKHYGEDNICSYPSVSFDMMRIPWRPENFFKNLPGSCSTGIEWSRNGLILCFLEPPVCRFVVYNPTLNLFKMLPNPIGYRPDNIRINVGIDFDPTKSPHYKVMYITLEAGDLFRLQTYSSQTGVWSIVFELRDRSHSLSSGIYLNDAIHFIGRGVCYCKLDLGNQNLVLTEVQLPITVNAYFCKLYESRGCLLLIGQDRKRAHQMNVYEMRNGQSEWSMKYSLNHPTIRYDGVRCIALGEREEDSFMVLMDSGNRVYLYNFVFKTFRKLPKLRSGLLQQEISAFSFLFTASFASV